MKIEIQLYDDFGENEIFFRQLIWTVEDENTLLVDQIQKAIDKYLYSRMETLADKGDKDYVKNLIGVLPSLDFNSYYSEEIMNSELDVLPYIFLEDHYEWNVPLEEVTVNDFIYTHTISNETIKVTAYYAGGAGDVISAIIEWLPIIMQYFSWGKDLFEAVRGVYKNFSGRNHKPASPYTVMEVIRRQSTWEIGELKKITRCKDETYLELLLLQAGFIKLDTGKYERKSTEKDYSMTLQNDKAIWGDYQENEEEDDSFDYQPNLAYALHELNKALTLLKMESEHNNTEDFERFMIAVEAFVDGNSYILKYGVAPRYIEMRSDLEEDISCKDEERLASMADNIREEIEQALFTFEDMD